MNREVRQASLSITGMSCAGCVGQVEKVLRGVPGVPDANVSLAAERATVEHLAGTTEMVDLERAVDGAGYGVVGGDGKEIAEEARVPAVAEHLPHRGAHPRRQRADDVRVHAPCPRAVA